MAKNRKKYLMPVTAICITALALLLAAFLIYTSACTSKNEVPFLFGKACLKIETPSMSPEIPEGEYILVERVTAEEVKVGDIIVFTSRDPQIYGILNTHRVIKINYSSDGEIESFSTKGDHNMIADARATSPGDVRGKYVRVISGLSEFEKFVSGKLVIILLLLIPMLAISVAAAEAVLAGRSKKRKDAEKKLFLSELEKLRKNGLPEDYKAGSDGKTDSEYSEKSEPSEKQSDDGGTAEIPGASENNDNQKEEN